ncbi:FimH mannose-binding protein [Serratia sp. AS12]|uniref:fimbrial protein n=1 Tax=Serratia TaxID=613 RepID=UPI00020E9304|nr:MULTISPECIES: fimbrial protein [Serratia]AEF44260.1 FimH mannose-binding protein [Serratia plymuthica AS9]AEF49212.1 FimH mannose-binding protein [Serratia sp. AS12]AEG26919.1 FimH mannose-binding protein [Serratia sp. AS13]UTN97786.1 fimbrial protein [Serratia plymuthica]
MHNILRNFKSINILSYFLFTLFLLMYAVESQALLCQNRQTGQEFHQGSYDVYVDLPTQLVGDRQTFTLVNIENVLQCMNEDSSGRNFDYVKVLRDGSTTTPKLQQYAIAGLDFDRWKGLSFPLLQDTFYYSVYKPGVWQPIPGRLFATLQVPYVGAFIRQGDVVGTLRFLKESTIGGAADHKSFELRFIAKNDLIIQGVCEAQPYVNVALPDFPGSAPLPPFISCRAPTPVRYTLDGTTTTNDRTIFSNIASTSPATGVGIQFIDENGSPIEAGYGKMKTVDSTKSNMGLTARYAQIPGQNITSGKVQSLVTVTYTIH